jgi:ferredoxin
MGKRINPNLAGELKAFGVQDWNDCYHCGNCTAVCPLTESNVLFPRKLIRYVQTGLKDKLAASPEPWLCYYCGDCSETCPRDANPGERMMAVRRFLSSVYDWTGLSRLFFTSKPAFFSAFIIVALAMLGMGFANNFKPGPLLSFGHSFEMIAIFAVAGVLLTPAIFRMFWFSIIKEKRKVPISAYITKSGKLILHMFTQLKGLKCTGGTFRWILHLLVVVGYITFLFTTVFLDWFGSGNIIVKYMGYIASGMVTLIGIFFIVTRTAKKKEVTKFSHISDWFFVIWLFLLGFTGFFVRLFIDLNLMAELIWVYMIHLIVLAQWAVILVPFGKWTHFLYRPFALYFSELRKAAEKK